MVKKLGVKKDKFFYGYIVVAAALLIVIIAHGAQYTFGIFFKLILTEFDWTKAVTPCAFSLYLVLWVFKAFLSAG